MTLGGTTLDLYFTGVSHGNGMTAFVLPAQKVNIYMSYMHICK